MPYKVKKTKKGYKIQTPTHTLPGVSKTRTKALARIRAIGMRTHGK